VIFLSENFSRLQNKVLKWKFTCIAALIAAFFWINDIHLGFYAEFNFYL